MEKNDFAIIEIAEKKHLVKCLKKDGKVYTGVLSASSATEKVVFKNENILANLGSEPKLGSAYGVKIEPFINMFHIKQLGEVHIYRKLEKKERDIIEQRFTFIGKKFITNGYTKALPLKIEIRNPKGKYAGTYKVNGEKADVLSFFPLDITDVKDTDRLIAHELGHMLFAHHLKNKQKAEWVELYYKGVTLETASKEEVEEVTRAFSRSKLTVEEFEDHIENDEKKLDIFYNIVDYVSEIHSLDEKFLDVLIKAGKDIGKYMPTGRMKLVGEYDILVSEYGSKNPEEFFAESVSYYLSDTKLNSEVKELVSKLFKA